MGDRRLQINRQPTFETATAEEGNLPLRQSWIVKRKEEAARAGDWNMSQMHCSRKGLIIEEMAYVAYKGEALG
jgi:hypothetical protein